jgi:rhodanese-related sulfurtransferase
MGSVIAIAIAVAWAIARPPSGKRTTLARMNRGLRRTSVFIRARAVGAVLCVLSVFIGSGNFALADGRPASSIPAQALVQPSDFAAALTAPHAPGPLILQVGFRKAYEQAHIPGSEYVGAASDEAGLTALRRRVARLTKDDPIVIYCGCCPWERCPNIAAAYEALRHMGFRKVKVIFIAEDFGTNWVDQGFPTVKGS